MTSHRQALLLRACYGAVAICFSALFASAALSEDHRVDRVSIAERGVFQATSEALPIARSGFGSVIKARNISLVKSTTTILARKLVRFGLRYVIVGSPTGAPVDVRLVTRFPGAGLFDPASGVRHYESEYTLRGAIGVPAYREFVFDHSWEIVAGEWVFEFWQAGRKIGSQRFCVLNAESSAHPADLSKASCSSLISSGKVGKRADLPSAGARS